MVCTKQFSPLRRHPAPARHFRTVRGLARTAALAAGILVAGQLPADEQETGSNEEIISFDKLEPGEPGDEFFVIDGSFEIVEDGEGRILRAASEPLLDYGVLVGESSDGPAAIKARVRAHRRGRSFPRAGIALHGLAGHRLRLVPARGEIEFAVNEETVATAPLEFESGAWYWLELRVDGSEDDGWTVTGYAWKDGEDKPAEPMLKRELETLRTTGQASLWATPYSGREIDFDDVTIERTGRD